jgi:hypothetical protein
LHESQAHAKTIAPWPACTPMVHWSPFVPSFIASCDVAPTGSLLGGLRGKRSLGKFLGGLCGFACCLVQMGLLVAGNGRYRLLTHWTEIATRRCQSAGLPVWKASLSNSFEALKAGNRVAIDCVQRSQLGLPSTAYKRLLRTFSHWY